jgi:hypothetical protein
LSLSCLLNFFLSFFSLAPTEAAGRQNQCQKNAKNNAKTSAKRALELRETKKAENDALVAQGIGVDAALSPDVVETIALNVVKQIENIVDEDGKVYIFTSAEHRIDVESFASVTGRGKGTPLISDKNGGNLTAKIMKDTYKWECKKSLYTTTSACTSSCLRTKCQSGSGTERGVSNWTRKGKFSNSHSQLFTDPVRASVLPPRIQRFHPSSMVRRSNKHRPTCWMHLEASVLSVLAASDCLLAF